MRGRKRKGTRYFGPYAHAYAIRETLDELLRSFPIRTCSPAKYNQHQRLGRPCLLYHIEKCSGPCVGEIEEVPYRQLVVELCDFLDGETAPIVNRLDAEMQEAAVDARVREGGPAARPAGHGAQAIERQQMVADTNEDIDVIGIADDELEASVQVFYVRKGRVVGRNGFVLDKVEELTPGRLVDRILEHLYGKDPPQGVPKQVLVPSEPEDQALYEEWLTLLRSEATGRPAQREREDPRARSAATAERCSRRSPTTPGRSSTAIACAAPATSTRAAGRSTSCRSTSICPRHRCASSATTWRTCRAPTTSARWSCSRTGFPTSASTAGSR